MNKAIIALVSLTLASALTFPGSDSTCGFVHDPLVTGDPPALDVANSGISIQGGETVLTITARASKRFYQADTVLGGETNATLCGQKFVAAADPVDPDCFYLIQGTIKWADHDTCGIALDSSSSSSTVAYFRGSLQITEHEHLPPLRNKTVDRELQRVLPFVIRFPKTASASHSITVFDNPYLLAAVIRQANVRSAAATANATAGITIYSSIQYPFKLNNAYFTYRSRSDFTTGSPALQTVLLSGGTCVDTASQVCEQEWAFDLNGVSPPVCTFTGDWNITFDIVCHASQTSNCPLQSGVTTSYTIPFHLTTEDFCPTLFADVRLTAALVSYQEAAHTTTKDNFLSGATAFFVATVTSPDATIVETSFISISSGATLIHSSGGTSPFCAVTEFPRVGGVSSHPREGHFALELVPSFFTVAADSSSNFNIGTTLNVVFANTEGSGVQRSFLMMLAPRARILAAGNNGGLADANKQVTLAGGASAAVASIGLVMSLVALLQLAM